MTNLSDYSSDQLRSILRTERRAATARIMILKREIRFRTDELEALESRLNEIEYGEDVLGKKELK